MTLKVDARSIGFQGVLYDNEDTSRTAIWVCQCTPPHLGPAVAKACALNKLLTLQKGRSLKKGR